jgi:hypothetical protein
MRLRRAVPKIPAKSSVPPTLPFHYNCPLLTPPESTLPQLLIPLHLNSFRNSVYKKPWGRGPAGKAQVCQLVTRHAPSLRTRRNPRKPSASIELLHNSRTPRGWGLSVLCALCDLCVKIPIPTFSDLGRYTQTDPGHLLSFTIHYSLLTTHYSLPPLLHYFFTSSPC